MVEGQGVQRVALGARSLQGVELLVGIGKGKGIVECVLDCYFDGCAEGGGDVVGEDGECRCSDFATEGVVLKAEDEVLVPI